MTKIKVKDLVNPISNNAGWQLGKVLKVLHFEQIDGPVLNIKNIETKDTFHEHAESVIKLRRNPSAKIGFLDTVIPKNRREGWKIGVVVGMSNLHASYKDFILHIQDIDSKEVFKKSPTSLMKIIKDE